MEQFESLPARVQERAWRDLEKQVFNSWLESQDEEYIEDLLMNSVAQRAEDMETLRRKLEETK